VAAAECSAIRALAGFAHATAGAGRAAQHQRLQWRHNFNTTAPPASQHLLARFRRQRQRLSRACSIRPPHETDLPPICTAFCQVADPSCILLYGFKVAFGGGRSTGFGMIYDSLVAAKKYEPKYRLTRFDMAKGKASGRKGRKEKKNRQKKIRGVKKTKGA